MDPTRFVDVTIDDTVFTIKKFEPFLAIKVLGSLQGKLLVPLLKALEIRGASSESHAVSALTDALEKLCASLDGDQMEHLLKTVLKDKYIGIHVAGKDQPVPFTEGNVNLYISSAGTLFELAVEVVKVNFHDFGPRIMTLIGKARSMNPGLIQNARENSIQS